MAMTKEELVKFWLESSERSYNTAKSLVGLKYYDYALYTLHLSFEKLLKSMYIKYIDFNFPRTHDLLLLLKKMNIEYSDEQRELFEDLNFYNIEGRYPDSKAKFYEMATLDFTNEAFKKVEGLRIWLLQKMN